MMLQATQVQILDCVKISVVISKPMDKSKVEAGEACEPENRQVGIVWQTLVDFIRKRIGYRMGSGLSEVLDEPAILIACLKHDGRTAGSARLKVQNEANIVRPRMLRDK